MGIATTTKTATTRQLSDQNSQGTVLGFGSTDKISFYGAATLTQPTSSWQSSIQDSTAAVAVASFFSTGITGTVWGYSSAQQANALLQCAQAMRTALVNLGLIKGS